MFDFSTLCAKYIVYSKSQTERGDERVNQSLREKCPSTEFFLVPIFLY